MRMIGGPACKKLSSVANGIIAAPGQDKAKNRLGDELLLGLAASGSPECGEVRARHRARWSAATRRSPTRAMAALYKAYVDPGRAVRPRRPGAARAEPRRRSSRSPRTRRMPAAAGNNAVVADPGRSACRTAGGPGQHDGAPAPDPRFQYVGGQQRAALRRRQGHQGGRPGRSPRRAYAQDELVGAVAGEIAKMSPKDQVVAAAPRAPRRQAQGLDRWVAIEALAAMKIPDEDAPDRQGRRGTRS